MTPKEKAEDLVDSFLRDGYDVVMHTRLAKRCALIAVDEIINYLGIIEQNETSDFSFGGSYQGDDYFKYWQEVKQEIEKL
jgi:hypothetical protein